MPAYEEVNEARVSYLGQVLRVCRFASAGDLLKGSLDVFYI